MHGEGGWSPSELVSPYPFDGGLSQIEQGSLWPQVDSYELCVHIVLHDVFHILALTYTRTIMMYEYVRCILKLHGLS